MEGCFRTHVTDEKGRENILHFSPEGAWIGDIQSATTGTPTPFFVRAIEDAVVLRIDLASFDALIAAIPDFGTGWGSSGRRPPNSAGSRCSCTRPARSAIGSF